MDNRARLSPEAIIGVNSMKTVGLAPAVLAASIASLSLQGASAIPLWDYNDASNALLDVGSGLAPLSLFWRAASTLTRGHSLLEARLVQTCAGCPPYWTTELGKHWLFWQGTRFVDLSDAYARDPQTTISEALVDDSAAVNAQSKDTKTHFPDKVAHKELLEDQVYPRISDKGPREHLKAFTAFRTRYYRSTTGRESQAWLLNKVRELAATRQDLDIEVSEFPHEWGQNSIILHVPGTKSLTSSNASGITIVGAHQDSTNLLPFLSAPGADDDGSGTVTLLEALRVLLATDGWRPATPVEFHWYSAEEGGLLGSQDVVHAYKEKGTKVKAMLQQDMTAFVKSGTKERVGLPIDFVDLNLRDFLKVLAKEYLNIPAVDTKLGWAASDHASWLKAGYPSAFAIEAPFEDCNMKRIHTSQDTFDHDEFSFSHLLQFVRLTAAFVVELGGLRGT